MEKTGETIKMCDMSSEISTKVFEMLNPDKVTVTKTSHSSSYSRVIFINDEVHSSDLLYPEGWVERFGYFTNCGNATGPMYELAKIYEKGQLVNELSIYVLMRIYCFGRPQIMKNHIKLCDMPVVISAKIFELLNPDKITIEETPLNHSFEIIYNANPEDLIYPEGWYYTQGFFTNKYNSTTTMYEKIAMHM